MCNSELCNLYHANITDIYGYLSTFKLSYIPIIFTYNAICQNLFSVYKLMSIKSTIFIYPCSNKKKCTIQESLTKKKKQSFNFIFFYLPNKNKQAKTIKT